MEEPSTVTVESTKPDSTTATNMEPEEQQEKVASGEKSDNSLYDSADSYTDNEADDDEPRRARSRASDGDSASESSVVVERQEGDGQECVPPKKVDDDEDKKNPQYIPKRGTFYEHDDRTVEDDEEVEVNEPEKTDKDGKKKMWQEKKERWSHDRFNETEQAPKSRSELVGIYGYDIRNEEGPPRARRRRRYGRGPNKYTRNWEDEDAYGKPIKPKTIVNKKMRPKRDSKSFEEFPPLENNGKSADEQSNTSKERRRSEESVKESNGNVSSQVEAVKVEQYTAQNRNNSQQSSTLAQQQQPRVGSGRVIKPRKEIKDSDYRGFTAKTRQVRNMKNEPQKNLPSQSNVRNQKRDDFIQSQNFTNKNNNNLQELEKEMNKMSVQEGGGGYKGGNKHNSQRQGSVPPRLQNEQKGSKRYSSMRQRSLPESATPPNFPTTFYPNDYSQQGPPPTSQQPILHQNPSQIHSTTTQVAQIQQQAPLPPIPQQVPVTAAPLLQPQFPPPPFPQPPPPFLQPGVAPPPFIPSQTPQIINYVQGQPPITPNFQVYQQPFNPVTQPTELYQPQGGITYYSTDQQVVQRSVPQKRPKAAIPIVAPPGIEMKGRGRKMDNDVGVVGIDNVMADSSKLESATGDEQFIDMQQ